MATFSEYHVVFVSELKEEAKFFGAFLPLNSQITQVLMVALWALKEVVVKAEEVFYPPISGVFFAEVGCVLSQTF